MPVVPATRVRAIRRNESIGVGGRKEGDGEGEGNEKRPRGATTREKIGNEKSVGEEEDEEEKGAERASIRYRKAQPAESLEYRFLLLLWIRKTIVVEVERKKMSKGRGRRNYIYSKSPAEKRIDLQSHRISQREAIQSNPKNLTGVEAKGKGVDPHHLL